MAHYVHMEDPSTNWLSDSEHQPEMQQCAFQKVLALVTFKNKNVVCCCTFGKPVIPL